MVAQEEIRKGPWTEQEDFQLVCFVGLFGDRRWDFIAKVSGLNRTGKSCRLRWVNYLHPGLKRGKMTPQEERLVLELHAKWGNRWSRIARKLPGRTDNEIKNYWRTHMRKNAQEKKRANNITSPSSSPSNSIKSSSSSSNITTVESLPFPDSTTGVESFYDTGGHVVSAPKEKKSPDNDQDAKKALQKEEEKQKEKEKEKEKEKGYYSMDDIWKEISLPEVNNDIINMELPFYEAEKFGNDNNNFNGNNNLISCPPLTTLCSSVWDDHHRDHEYYCSDSLWKMDDEEAGYKPFFPTANDQFFSCFGYGENLLTG